MDRLDVPRISIRALEPAIPSPGFTDTPGSRADRVSENVSTGRVAMMSAGCTVAIVLPNCFFAISTPAPVTTISSSEITDARSAKFSSNV